MYEIIRARFEFDNIDIDDSNFSVWDVAEWYLATDRANEEIIDITGDGLDADNILLTESDLGKRTVYNHGTLSGVLYLLQWAEYDDDGELIRATVMRKIVSEDIIEVE